MTANFLKRITLMKHDRNKGKFSFFIGFAILALMTLVLYGISTYTAVMLNIIPGLSLIVILSAIIFAMCFELVKQDVPIVTEKVFTPDNFFILTSVFAGAIITYLSSVHLGLSSVVVSGIVGLAVAIFIPKYAAPAFCGSFAGMSSIFLLPITEMLIAAIFTGIIYIIAKNTLNGFGGKFGTIAFSACLITALITGKTVFFPEIIETGQVLLFLAFSISSAVLTYMLSVRVKTGPVIASGFVGIMAGIWLPEIFPVSGSALAVMVFCSSFIGMSSPKRLENEFKAAAAGLVAGIAFIYSTSIQGTGGKLGTLAFGSVLAIYGITMLSKRITALVKSAALKN